MTTKSQRLKTIVNLKLTQEQESLEALGKAQHKLSALQAQVDNLKKYRQDYQEKFNNLGNKGTNVSQLLEFRSFMDKLDKAIAGQENSLQQTKMDVTNKRKHWESLHHNLKSLEKVYLSAQKTEYRLHTKAEQLEQDERASRLGRNKIRHNANP